MCFIYKVFLFNPQKSKEIELIIVINMSLFSLCRIQHKEEDDLMDIY